MCVTAEHRLALAVAAGVTELKQGRGKTLTQQESWQPSTVSVAAFHNSLKMTKTTLWTEVVVASQMVPGGCPAGHTLGLFASLCLVKLEQ